MHRVRPQLDSDDDLEELQRQFLENEQRPSASVVRKGPPTFGSSMSAPKKSVSFKDVPDMPGNDDNDDDDDAFASMPGLEPVYDPHPEEPHAPAVKKMLDLTSMLGSVLGDVKEHKVTSAQPPTMPTAPQTQGFPKPPRRSRFKAARDQAKKAEPVAQPPVATPDANDSENDTRIAAMSAEEIEDAQQEIMATLSPASIAFLKGRLASHGNKKDAAPPRDDVSVPLGEKDDLLAMKEQYFADVPLEADKLAWMDERFAPPTSQEAEGDDGKAVDPVFRQWRFDLQGHRVDEDAKVHDRALHHHADEPDKPGYTLAELFRLVRSQMPSQRVLVLTTLTRILHRASFSNSNDNAAIVNVFRRPDVAAAAYFRSALDDRHLAVVVQALQALRALLTLDFAQNDENGENRQQDDQDALEYFNTAYGHVRQPLLHRPRATTKSWVKQFQQQQQQGGEDPEESDTGLAARDMAGALLKMDLLARLRYLMDARSELRKTQPAAIRCLLGILCLLCKSKSKVAADGITDHDLGKLALDWIDSPAHQMMTTAQQDDNHKNNNNDDDGPAMHRLAVLQFITILAQSSRRAALGLKDRVMTLTFPWLAVGPPSDTDARVQIEAIKLLRVYVCYGVVLATLVELQPTMLGWLQLAAQIEENEENDDEKSKQSSSIVARAATVVVLYEMLLHAAADPHKTVPAHAIDWHQATSPLPVIILLLERAKNTMLQATCTGYLATWAAMLAKFPKDAQLHLDRVAAIVQHEHEKHDEKQQTDQHQHHQHHQQLSAYHLLRQCQLITLLDEKLGMHLFEKGGWLLQPCSKISNNNNNNSYYGRWLAFLIWQHKETMTTPVQREQHGPDDIMVQLAVSSRHAGLVETWLAQALVQHCVLPGAAAKTLAPFFAPDAADLATSLAIKQLDGRKLDSLCYPREIHFEEMDKNEGLDALAFILSPIDELYYWDKSRVTQQLLQQHDDNTTTNNEMSAAAIIVDALGLALQMKHLDPAMLLVGVMKIFLVGDREGQPPHAPFGELFWNERVTDWMEKCMDRIDHRADDVNLPALDNAWRASPYTRDAHVPFYQFYQGFLAHYAAVSIGNKIYSRVLAFVAARTIDQKDYKHLLFSDHRDDILPMLQRQGYPI
ncbi:hypothetical protein BC940DRAFT_322476 [Gongronella butleri]|nr:hypothetical protein BC940DRAFT_322476 [Gongronella butleri]